jgi:uncharacterized protein YbaP (TraB family)
MASMVRRAREGIGRVARLVFVAMLFSTASSFSAPVPPTKHFIWRVTNLPVPFYLVGSIHNLKPGDYPLPEIYQQALLNSRRVLFEYNPAQREALARKFREAAKYPSGQDVRNDLRPATLALLQRNLWRFNLSFDAVRRYRPWAIALRLLSTRGLAAASSARSMDFYLSYQAQRLRKEVAGLESVDEHIAFWEEMLARDGENLLLYTLTHSTAVTDLFDQTRAAWKRGDIAALSATNGRLRQANAGIANRLLDRRNLNWVARIEAEMKTGKPTAIVAGAGHFSGPGSVVELLRKRGYKIEQL